MPRLTLDREIRLIQDETLLLGSLVEQAVLNAVDALKSRDAAAARAVIRNDIFINDKRFAIENRILILLHAIPNGARSAPAGGGAGAHYRA